MTRVSRRQWLTTMTSLAWVMAGTRGTLGQAPGPLIEVMKDPGCGCCELWAEHLRKAGFRVTVSEASDRDGLHEKYRVPPRARSCHTGVVAGYALEGHVPSADVKRLLAQRPDVLGIAVPGMPLGSPGMEVASGRVQPYDVVSFDKNGVIAVFAPHR